jgi:dTDP-4-amino-4,6-dideoxygalactose transaminase
MALVETFSRLVKRYGWRHALRYLVNHAFLRRHYTWPVYGRREFRQLRNVLRGREWGGLPSPNRYAKEFAERFAAHQTARFGVCTTSGSTALYVAYKAAGLKRGDEILVPALTFSSTAGAALEQGIRPVFVDVDPGTMCIDPRATRDAVTPATKAIVAVHLGAQMADMDSLLALARERGLILIEDCAHAHGAKWEERGAGSLGTLGCFSFQSSKLMTAGEGGIILTNDEKIADRCHSYVNCGRKTRDEDVPQTCLGSNYRITDVQAALLLAQLQRLPAHTRRRHENAQLFTKLLDDLRGVRAMHPYPKVSTQSVFGYYFRYLAEECRGIPRERFIRDLRENGIPAVEEIFLPVYRSEEFGWRDAPIDVDYTNTRCPVAEQAASEELVWIPHRVFLAGRRQIEWMATIIDEVLRDIRGEGN